MQLEPRAKLYVVTREDLFPGYQLAQSAHAAVRFGIEHHELATQWAEQSEYICCLSVPSESILNGFRSVAVIHRIPHSAFYEPDINDQLTAVAFAPSKTTRLMLKGLPLALKD